MISAVLVAEARDRRETPANLTPFLADDDLESRRLERVQGWALLFAAVVAVALPLYWLHEPTPPEPSRQLLRQERGRTRRGPVRELRDARVQRRGVAAVRELPRRTKGGGGDRADHASTASGHLEGAAAQHRGAALQRGPDCVEPVATGQPTRSARSPTSSPTAGRARRCRRGVWPAADRRTSSRSATSSRSSDDPAHAGRGKGRRRDARAARSTTRDVCPQYMTCPDRSADAKKKLDAARSARREAQDREKALEPPRDRRRARRRCNDMQTAVADDPAKRPTARRRRRVRRLHRRRDDASPTQRRVAWATTGSAARERQRRPAAVRAELRALPHRGLVDVRPDGAADGRRRRLLGLPGGGGGTGGGIGFNLRDGGDDPPLRHRRGRRLRSAGRLRQHRFGAVKAYGNIGIGTGKMPGFAQDAHRGPDRADRRVRARTASRRRLSPREPPCDTVTEAAYAADHDDYDREKGLTVMRCCTLLAPRGPRTRTSGTRRSSACSSCLGDRALLRLRVPAARHQPRRAGSGSSSPPRLTGFMVLLSTLWWTSGNSGIDPPHGRSPVEGRRGRQRSGGVEDRGGPRDRRRTAQPVDRPTSSRTSSRRSTPRSCPPAPIAGEKPPDQPFAKFDQLVDRLPHRLRGSRSYDSRRRDRRTSSGTSPQYAAVEFCPAPDRPVPSVRRRPMCDPLKDKYVDPSTTTDRSPAGRRSFWFRRCCCSVSRCSACTGTRLDEREAQDATGARRRCRPPEPARRTPMVARATADRRRARTAAPRSSRSSIMVFLFAGSLFYMDHVRARSREERATHGRSLDPSATPATSAARRRSWRRCRRRCAPGSGTASRSRSARRTRRGRAARGRPA